VQVSFIKDYHSYKSDTPILVTVPFLNNFYCLKYNGQVITINKKTNEEDLNYHDNSKSIALNNIYLKSDTLIGTNKTDTYYLTQGNNWTFLRKGIQVQPVYEDNDYIIMSTCSGEWGGSIYLQNKSTKHIYTCNSTCTLNIIRAGTKYIVNASLPHLSGFTNVFEINDPTKLKSYNIDSLKKVAKYNQRKHRIGYVGENESRSRQGTIQLIDSIGILSLASFVYNSQIFYLVSNNHGKTFITTIRNGKFATLDTLIDKDIWSYYPSCKKYDETTIYSFSNSTTSGFVAIDADKLRVYSFDQKL